MIAEVGHYALVLALALALIQGTAPIAGAWKGDAVLMGVTATTALAQFAFVAAAFAALTARLCRLRLLGRERVRELAFGDAAHLQVHERLGEP